MSETEGKCSHSTVGIVIALLVFLFLYILSFGPVMVFCPPFCGQAIRYIYAPVIWLHDNTILAIPLKYYLEFWINLFG
jgi:hypothetical protein